MGHLELARLGRDADVRNLVASHISEQMDVPGVRERLIREIGLAGLKFHLRSGTTQ